jgi:hypothetical protein
VAVSKKLTQKENISKLVLLKKQINKVKTGKSSSRKVQEICKFFFIQHDEAY